VSRTVRFEVKWYEGERHRITFRLGDYRMLLSGGGPVGPHGLAEEAADLIYHTLVALRAAGASLDDVRGTLDARAGRPPR